MNLVAVIDDGDVYNSHVTTYQGVGELEKAIEIVQDTVSSLESCGFHHVFAVIREVKQLQSMETICSYSSEEGWKNIPMGIV